MLLTHEGIVFKSYVSPHPFSKMRTHAKVASDQQRSCTAAHIHHSFSYACTDDEVSVQAYRCLGGQSAGHCVQFETADKCDAEICRDEKCSASAGFDSLAHAGRE